MISTLPKFILGALVVAGIVFVAIWLARDTADLRVEYENGLLAIQNVGEKPVVISGVAVNDRTDCQLVNIVPQGSTLKVGDKLVLMTPCDVVRVTITTPDGSDTYSLAQ